MNQSIIDEKSMLFVIASSLTIHPSKSSRRLGRR